ncbi:MAG: hypothetical protein AB1423_12645 [Pseudomonadota bacterium]
MSSVFSNTAKIVLGVEKVIIKAVTGMILGKNANYKQQSELTDKYFIDKYGSITINKKNIEVQNSFDKNLKGLSNKKGC